MLIELFIYKTCQTFCVSFVQLESDSLLSDAVCNPSYGAQVKGCSLFAQNRDTFIRDIYCRTKKQPKILLLYKDVTLYFSEAST